MVIWYGRTPVMKFGGGGGEGHNQKDESRPEKYNLCVVVVLVDSVDCPCLGHKMLHVLHKYNSGPFGFILYFEIV